MVVSPEFDDPLRGPATSARFWTTVNAAEALPGVPSPLNWTWYDEGTELAMLRGMVGMGICRERDVVSKPDRDQRLLGIFQGHAAINVDEWRRMADSIPGTSGSAFERDLLGGERPGQHNRPEYARYPLVAIKAPFAFRRAARDIRAGAELSKRIWRATIEQVLGADELGSRAAFGRAFARYEEVAVSHLVASMAAQGLFDRLKQLSDRAGLAGYETKLTTGLGGTEEGEMLGRLWRIARGGDGSLEAFVADYGYHGPQSGELSSTCWREHPQLLEPLLEAYRSLDEAKGPAVIAERQRAERLDAERELLGRLSRLQREPTRLLVRIARAFLPYRESGRAEILRAVDTGRAAARAYAAAAQSRGALDQPEDVFMMTVLEMSGGRPMPGPEELAFRRERREAYRLIDVPDVWQGIPEPTPVASSVATDGGAVSGIGTGSGVAEGPVRVVRDPAVEGAEMEPGDVLVCHTTDPSWASLFLLAAAVVIDIGGPISHGAIVARELGIPGVINTKTGTRALRTGELVRVDGHAGTVERIDRSA